MSPHYDPMIAKLVVRGADRGQAIDRMGKLLAEVQIAGVASNAAFLAAIMRHPEFSRGALDTGFQMREIHESAYRMQQEVERGDRIVVGVNAFRSEAPPIKNIQRIDPAQTRRQLARLGRVKRERDGDAVGAALARVKAVAEGEDNTVPAILEAVEAYATVGEIADTLRVVFGEQHEFAPF